MARIKKNEAFTVEREKEIQQVCRNIFAYDFLFSTSHCKCHHPNQIIIFFLIGCGISK